MMGNLIVRQIQFLLEKMNLRQNSYRQAEGVRRSKRMRMTSPLMSLSLLCLSYLSVSLLSPPSLSSLSLSCLSLTPQPLPCLSPSSVSPLPSPYSVSPRIGCPLSLHTAPLPCLSRLSVFSVCSSSLHHLYRYSGINGISI